MRLLFISLMPGLTVLFAACSGAGSSGQQTQNEKIIQRYYGEVWNQGKLDVLDELLDKQKDHR